MVRKHYSDEFRRQAVELYETTPGASMRQIGGDLGVSRYTLADWVRQLGTGMTTQPGGSPAPARVEETDAEKISGVPHSGVTPGGRPRRQRRRGHRVILRGNLLQPLERKTH
ncbi:MAG: transposase, partial [Microbacterium sp.]